MNELAKLVVVSAVVLATTPALADEPPPSVIVTATASAALDKSQPWMVLDSTFGNGNGWCVERGVGASMTLTFEKPIPVTGLQLSVGLVGPNTNGVAAPDHVQVTAGTQTADLTKLVADNPRDIPLDGSAISSVTVKIVSLPPVKSNRACIAAVRVLSPKKYYYQFVTGVDRAAMTALAQTAHALDAALRTCDAQVIGAAVKGPVVHEHAFSSTNPNEPAPASKLVTYKTAAELVAACTREGSFLASGYAGGSHVASLDDDLPLARSGSLGRVSLGDNTSRGWTLAWNAGAWSLVQMMTSEPTDALGVQDLTDLAASQLALAGPLPKDTFTADAKFVMLDGTHTVAKPSELGGWLGIKDSASGEIVPNLGVSRDGETMWATSIAKYGKRELHVTQLLVKTRAGWLIAGGMFAEAQPNAAVDKAAAAGKLAAFAPLPASTRSDDLAAAVAALATGPLDKVASARAQLIAFGSGPGERSTSGRALAAPWAAAWSKHVAFGGAVYATSPSGRTAWVAVDATLDKKQLKQPFRLFFVFDRAGSGAWTLVQAQFVSPPAS